MPNTFDRSVQAIGNITQLEHVNLRVPDLGIADIFFVHGLGLTRDPYIDLGPELVWFNVGRQQFHIPLSADRADVLRGTIVLSVPNLDSFIVRLTRAAPYLSDTSFGFTRTENSIEITGPWGNQFRCVEASTDRMPLGISAVELAVPERTTPGIAEFYRQAFDAPARVANGRCDVVVGAGQRLSFVEAASVPEYDGHHIAVYISDFAAPHSWLSGRDLIVEETNAYQYRFNWIVHPETDEPLFELEHEVRSQDHPLKDRLLINKNPDQRLQEYLAGADALWPHP